MFKRQLVLGGLLLGAACGASAACENAVPLKTLTNAFPAYEIMTSEMQACGNVESELDKDHRLKLQDALAVNPSLYQLVSTTNATSVALFDENLLRPLDDLIEKHGQDLSPSQKISVDGKTMVIPAFVNTQHLMYRKDILDELGLAVPTTWDEVLETSQKIKEANVVDYPYTSYYKADWNLGFVFVNHFLGDSGEFFKDGFMPDINNETGVAVLERMKALSEFMDPEYLVADSTFVTKQLQQGKVAMAMLWASRAGAVNDPEESTHGGEIVMASAPIGTVRPAASIWWDGWAIARNTSDEEAEAAMKVIMHSMREEVISQNNDDAIWLAKGFTPGLAASGAAATAEAGAAPYPASKQFTILHNALAAGLADYLTGAKDASTTLADIEASYIKDATEEGLL